MIKVSGKKLQESINNIESWLDSKETEPVSNVTKSIITNFKEIIQNLISLKLKYEFLIYFLKYMEEVEDLETLKLDIHNCYNNGLKEYKEIQELIKFLIQVKDKLCIVNPTGSIGIDLTSLLAHANIVYEQHIYTKLSNYKFCTYLNDYMDCTPIRKLTSDKLIDEAIQNASGAKSKYPIYKKYYNEIKTTIGRRVKHRRCIIAMSQKADYDDRVAVEVGKYVKSLEFKEIQHVREKHLENQYNLWETMLDSREINNELIFKSGFKNLIKFIDSKQKGVIFFIDVDNTKNKERDFRYLGLNRRGSLEYYKRDLTIFKVEDIPTIENILTKQRSNVTYKYLIIN